jgi:hypothetical protein
MKKVIQIIGFILLIVDLYLIYVYNIHDDWNKLERRIFGIALILGLIITIYSFYQNKRPKYDQNEK